MSGKHHSCKPAARPPCCAHKPRTHQLRRHQSPTGVQRYSPCPAVARLRLLREETIHLGQRSLGSSGGLCLTRSADIVAWPCNLTKPVEMNRSMSCGRLLWRRAERDCATAACEIVRLFTRAATLNLAHALRPLIARRTTCVRCLRLPLPFTGA
jgi:hypothetical protein